MRAICEVGFEPGSVTLAEFAVEVSRHEPDGLPTHQFATATPEPTHRSLPNSTVKHSRRHIVIVFFDDYESAIANSNLPETQAFGEKQFALLDVPPTFTDLDIIDERD